MKQLDLLLKKLMFKKYFNTSISYFIIPILKYVSSLFKNEIDHIKRELKRTHDSALIYPDIYINYLIFSEDKRFFVHKGVDFFAVCRACVNITFLNKFQGASTIEQQVVRTILKDYRISLVRKVKEQALASFLSTQYSKKDIAVIYLNLAYVGQFDKKLQTTGIEDHASSLVAAIRYPVPKKYNVNWSRKYNVRKMLILDGLSREKPSSRRLFWT